MELNLRSDNDRHWKLKKIFEQYNPHIANIDAISGALFTMRIQYECTQTQCDEGARDGNDIWYMGITTKNKDALVGTLFILKMGINLLNFRKFHLIDMRLSNIRLCQYNLLQFYSNLEHSCKDMIRLYLYKSHFPKLNPCHIFFRLQSVFTCQNFVGHNLNIRHIWLYYIPHIRKLFLSIHFYLRSITQKV